MGWVCDAVGDEGESVVQSLDALFEVEDTDIEQVELGLFEPSDCVDQGEFQVRHEVPQFTRHVGRCTRLRTPSTALTENVNES